MNIKNLIASQISNPYPDIDLEKLIIESISNDKGDFSLPCFSLAKSLHDNPMNIANNIKNSVKLGGLISSCEVVAGYVNFFFNKPYFSHIVLDNFSSEQFASNVGCGKTICIDYGSPNLAKFLHIGHLKTLIIGESLARLFELNGYTVKRLNFIGDYGTPFGKIIGGLLKWGSLEEAKLNGVDALQGYYIKFNQAEAEDESLSQYARDLFKKIEDRDPEIYPIYQMIIDITLDDCVKKFASLGVKFDDFRGENYYNDFTSSVLKMLEEKSLLVESQGAKIVDLSAFDMAPSVLVKNDGTSLYATRDLAAAIDRNKEYNPDKILYVTDVAQTLHFKQWFKIVELADLGFANKLEHVAYGRFSLPDGKISSRRGKQAVLADLMEYCMDKVQQIIKDRKFEIEKPEDIANKVVRAVLNYNVLKVERIKDCVFDIEKAFSFEGETAPYMQYTYTRLESILRKYEETNSQPDYACLDNDAFEIVKMINSFGDLLADSLAKRDSSMVGKRVMEMCKTFNKMYTNCKILDGNDATTKAKINLVRALKDTLAVGFNILCIDTLKEM